MGFICESPKLITHLTAVFVFEKGTSLFQKQKVVQNLKNGGCWKLSSNMVGQ